jgi:hypothetical protein
MKIVRRFTANAAAFLALSLLILTVSTIDSHAQANRQVTAIERRVQTMDQQSKQYEIDNMGRDGKKSQVDAKRAREIKNEIAEDLNGLQSSYNEIVLILQEKDEPAETFAHNQLGSVHKKSVRLKANLALPKLTDTEEKENAAPPKTDTRRGLLRLVAKRIYDVITNPIFESTSGLDVKLATKASKDLDTLIASTASVNP